jgi:hypothetical protein
MGKVVRCFHSKRKKTAQQVVKPSTESAWRPVEKSETEQQDMLQYPALAPGQYR